MSNEVKPVCVVCLKPLSYACDETVLYDGTSGLMASIKGGVSCSTSGNYGSRVLDDDGLVTFCICDECMVSRGQHMLYVKCEPPLSRRVLLSCPFSETSFARAVRAVEEERAMNTCNHHSDCKAADKASGGKSYHCRIDDCEDCYGC